MQDEAHLESSEQTHELQQAIHAWVASPLFDSLRARLSKELFILVYANDLAHLEAVLSVDLASL